VTTYQNCAYCCAPVLPDAPDTFVRVTAWEHRAFAGGSRRGGSDLCLRERLPEYACSECVQKLKRGIAPVQGALI
jgi:hypothetical protein